ncbi:MAG: alpha/beta hydrolase fold domain-containing protein [Bacteroidota bacterium]
MKALILTFLLNALVTFGASGQRFRDQIFNQVSRKTVSYLKGRDLQMDIYQPTADTKKDRPVLLYVHGGGFAGGARDQPEIIDFCKNMARRGIVAVSMSYTLVMKGKSFGCDQAAANKLNAFQSVSNEIVAASNYLIENKEELRINTSQVVLAGSSAGAEAVLHVAYQNKARATLPSDFTYAGVVSMAGAIHDVNLINAETAIPTQLFHGTCDDLVPYGTAPHHYCNEGEAGYLILHGAQTITQKLQDLNKGYYLVTACNDNHNWAEKPFKEYRAQVADFIWQDVLQEKFRQIHQVITTNKTCSIASAPVVCQ